MAWRRSLNAAQARCSGVDRRLVGFGVFWVVTIPATVPASALAARTPNLDNGKTMFLIGGCTSCHATPGPGRQDAGSAAASG